MPTLHHLKNSFSRDIKNRIFFYFQKKIRKNAKSISYRLFIMFTQTYHQENVPCKVSSSALEIFSGKEGNLTFLT